MKCTAAMTRPDALHRTLGPVSGIPLGEGRVFAVDGRRIAVFRPRDGRLFAAEADCPHRGGPLADGLLGGSIVICPLHGLKFDLATGQPVGHDCRSLATYPVEVTPDDEIILRVNGR